MFLWLHGTRGEARVRGGTQACRAIKGPGTSRGLLFPPPSVPQQGNFEESQETMKRQLGRLLLLLRVLDPQLCDFLGMSLGQVGRRQWGRRPYQILW